MTTPLISIVIPIYNSEEYLTECVNSVINQTYKNIEIILVDDGSTDNSPKMCDEYALKDNRVNVIHKENGGVSSARNIGIKQASGDYIMFVDSDDKISLLLIEKYIDILDENDDVIIINYLCDKNTNEYTSIKLDELEKNEAIYNILKWKNNSDIYKKYTGIIGHLYNRNKLISNSIYFNNDLIMGEDMIFNIEILLTLDHIKCLFFNGYYYNYDNQHSLSRKINKNIVTKDTIFHNRLFELLNENNYLDIYEIAKVRSPLGGILCCCNSYFFKPSPKSINKYIYELKSFINNPFYKDPLEKIKEVKDLLTTKDYALLVLIKNRMYYLAYTIKKISMLLKKNG